MIAARDGTDPCISSRFDVNRTESTAISLHIFIQVVLYLLPKFSKRLAQLGVLQMRVLFGHDTTCRLCPHHERIHWPFDVLLLAIRWSPAIVIHMKWLKRRKYAWINRIYFFAILFCCLWLNNPINLLTSFMTYFFSGSFLVCFRRVFSCMLMLR